MKYFQKRAIILKFIQSLEENGNWCSETRIQKSFYFLQQLAKVPTEFSFIFYKLGPFSFDLQKELAAMRADYLLNVQLNAYPYGPSMCIAVDSSRIEEMAPKTLIKYKNEIAFITKKLGLTKIYELECLATALYTIIEKIELKSDNKRITYIQTIKPWEQKKDIKQSIITVHELISAFKKEFSYD